MRVRVYLAHDTEDVDLVNLLVDILQSTGIFDVFLSPFHLPGTVPKLDDVEKAEIRSCDFLIALFTRISLRSTLVKQEIEFARLENKVVVPMVQAFTKLRKIGDIKGPYPEIKFSKRNFTKAVERFLLRMNVFLSKHGVSQDAMKKAMRVIKGYSKPTPTLRERIMYKASRMTTFQGIVAEALKKLGYSILERRPFEMMVTKKGSRASIVCFLRSISEKDIVRRAKHMSSDVSNWIVSTGVYSLEAQSMAIAKGIELVPIQRLLNELPPSDKEYLWQGFVQVMHAYATPTVNQNLYPELRTSVRAVYRAKTSAEKGKSLERLAECFVSLFPGLKVVGKNIRIEAEELDLVVKNEAEKIFWQRLETPIIVECKNWTKPVGAREIRDLVQKMREVKTALLIAAHGVTSKDGAYYEIIEARKNKKFILVLDITDIDEILRGTNPEGIIQERFYSLWTRD